ncbi:MAG: four helix bundle protein [Roseburia sp.]|nr:four helix bundle protein [Roseburia sp.]
MKRRAEDELTVITRAKELCEYILTITDKSPKKFRFTLVSRLQNYSLSVIEHLYRANNVFVANSDKLERYEKRLEFQHEAMTELRLLAYLSMIARESQCILPKQQSQISSKIIETQKLLYAWIKSDGARAK